MQWGLYPAHSQVTQTHPHVLSLFALKKHLVWIFHECVLCSVQLLLERLLVSGRTSALSQDNRAQQSGGQWKVGHGTAEPWGHWGAMWGHMKLQQLWEITDTSLLHRYNCVPHMLWQFQDPVWFQKYLWCNLITDFWTQFSALPQHTSIKYYNEPQGAACRNNAIRTGHFKSSSVVIPPGTSACEFERQYQTVFKDSRRVMKTWNKYLTEDRLKLRYQKCPQNLSCIFVRWWWPWLQSLSLKSLNRNQCLISYLTFQIPEHLIELRKLCVNSYSPVSMGFKRCQRP